jgi:Transcriptional regulator, AbiEi antitoxin
MSREGFRAGGRGRHIRAVEPLSIVRMVAAGQHGVITSAQCRDAGVDPGLVKKLCRSRQWVRLHEGAYLVDADEAGPSRRSLISAGVRSAGPRAVAVLGTAAEVLGIGGLRREDVIHVSLPGTSARPRRPTDAGVRPHQLVIRARDITTVDGIPVTTAVRTVADLLLRLDRLTAVCVLDSCLNRRLLVADDIDLVRTLLHHRRGAVRARPWLLEADGRAESPLETRVRLRASDGGVAPDELQFRVRDVAGNIVAIGDMAWLPSRIIGEADGGEAHEQRAAVLRDRKRQNDIIAAGYLPVRFTWEDTLGPTYIPRVIRSAMVRSLRTRFA